MNGRRATLTVLATAGALAVSGCAPIMTQHAYAPSDGLRVVLADGVIVQNLLVLTAAEGDPGAVLGAVRNSGPADAVVSLAGTDLQVEAGQTVLIGGEAGRPLLLDAVDAAPGATLPLEVGIVGQQVETVPVPVLDGELPQYAPYVPTA
ncbi:MAG: hypothetical protein ACTMIR_03605 [Cellulomonadaceae bacterium]